MNYRRKRVLVTGGTGTIGPALVRRLLEAGASVTVASIDGPERARAVLPADARYCLADLRDRDVCSQLVAGQDHVFHLMAVKGSTQLGVSRVASMYVPFILCNTHMMEAAFRARVQRFLFVGSICQYPPLPVRHEDDAWKGPPAANDRFAGIAKLAGEAQAEAYLQEHGWDAVRVVRPANVYGPFDDFHPSSAHVIPALIRRVVSGEDPLRVAGDGTAERDFIYSEDVAEGMLLALERAPPCVPINLGSGIGTTVRELAAVIAEQAPHVPRIVFEPDRPTGDPKRVLDVQRARELLGFEASTPLREGIRKTFAWYEANRELAERRPPPVR